MTNATDNMTSEITNNVRDVAAENGENAAVSIEMSFENSEVKDFTVPLASETPKSARSGRSRSPRSPRSPRGSVILALDSVTKDLLQSTAMTTKGLAKGVTNATKSTAKGVTKVTVSTAKQLNKATELTSKTVETAFKQSEDVYEKSRWCWVPRFFVQNFPRVFSLTFGVVVPLWFLILISAGFGFILADFEAPQELESNNAILEARARVNRTFVKRTDLGTLPVQCLRQYLNQTNHTQFEERILDYIIDTSGLDDLDASNFTDANITAVNDTNVVTPDIGYALDDILLENEEQLLTFMIRCQNEQNDKTEAFLGVNEEYGSTAAGSLTFNWNRCWSEPIRAIWGDTTAVYFPPESLIAASRPDQQGYAVETEFVRILEEEEVKCIMDGGDSEDCFEQGLEAATALAANVCKENIEATSWFFFTIMTTIGYGNQAPVTYEGRLLIYIAGILSLILFAGVLGSSGYIITAIFDDFVARLNFAKFLRYPLVGVVYWGAIWVGWSYLIATYADQWWQVRLPDFDVDVGDTMWFAFISTSTIGLGDYFLQPSVMFASDALGFSVLMLVGFVFLSTFLNKLGEFLFSMVPKRENSLETRLKETNLIFWKHWPCNDYLRSYMPDLHALDFDDSSVQLKEEMQKQEQRVQTFRSHLPNNITAPQLNTMEGEKNMVNLLNEEEMVLKALLESVQHRRNELTQAGQVSNPAVVTTPLMTGVVVVPPLDFERGPVSRSTRSEASNDSALSA